MAVERSQRSREMVLTSPQRGRVLLRILKIGLLGGRVFRFWLHVSHEDLHHGLLELTMATSSTCAFVNDSFLVCPGHTVRYW